jgi:predicted metalloprotease with PDZ domain
MYINIAILLHIEGCISYVANRILERSNLVSLDTAWNTAARCGLTNVSVKNKRVKNWEFSVTAVIRIAVWRCTCLWQLRSIR